MPKRANWLVIAVLVVVAVVAVIAVALPLVISSDAVKQRIIDQVQYMTGRTFTFRGEPSISLYPYLTVRLSDAKLANAEGMGDEPFIEAETMTGKLEILPLLTGQMDFARFRFVNPRINLRTGADGRGNWIMDQGAIGSLVSKGDKEGASDDQEPASPLADIKVGRFNIRDGIVTFHDDRSGRTEELSKVNVNFDWTSTSQAATGSGEFIWRGEPVDFDGGIDAPLDLLSGGGSPLRFAFSATPVQMSFSGNALQLGGTQLEGDVELTTPSVRRIIEWMGGPTGSGAILGAGSIAGKINWLGPSINVSEATLELDDNEAEGALSATVVDGLSSLQGTLAFDTLDVSPYIEAARAIMAESADTWESAPLDISLDSMGEIDLRVSTSELIAGTLSIGRTAATAILDQGQLVVTIGEAEIDEGTAEARVTVESDDAALVGSAEIELIDVSLAGLMDILGLPSTISGRTTATFNVESRGVTAGAFAQAMTGEGRVEVAEGTLEGVDLTALPAGFADPGADATEGSTAFATVMCTAVIGDGRITTGDLEVAGDGFTLGMSGSAGLLEPDIEGRGVLVLSPPDTPPEDVPFLIDGTWDDARLLPDLGPPVERDHPAPETVGPQPLPASE